jgi:3-polyprenyl-4-hydroxybenzoate decarboxylase
MNLPVHGVFHNLAIISIKKEYPAQARKVMHALWGLGQMMFTKTLIIVDHDVNIHDLSEVTWVVGNNIDPKRDTVFVDGPVDVLDHAAPATRRAQKWVSTPRENGAAKVTSGNGPVPSSWTKRSGDISIRYGRSWEYRESCSSLVIVLVVRTSQMSRISINEFTTTEDNL